MKRWLEPVHGQCRFHISASNCRTSRDKLLRFCPTTSRHSLRQLNLTWAPGLIKPGLQWPIHAQDHKPALTRDRLKPVVLFACRRFRREIDVVRAVRVLLYSLGLASYCGKALV